MNKLKGIQALYLILLVLVACDSRPDYDKRTSPDQYRYIDYKFGSQFYCIPFDDFTSGPMATKVRTPVIIRRTFTRSDALLVEGGLTDRVRFFTGDGRISVKWNIKNGSGYYLRVLKCSDIFRGAQIINGFSVYIQLS